MNDLAQIGLLTHPYLLGIYGALLFWIASWSIARSKESWQGIKSFRKWGHDNIDEIIVTFAVVPLVVIFDDEILNLYSRYQNIENVQEFHKMVYLSSGFLSMLILKIIKKFHK